MRFHFHQSRTGQATCEAEVFDRQFEIVLIEEWEQHQMNALYTTKVTATGGRHGQIRSEDGLLDMKLALPRELG